MILEATAPETTAANPLGQLLSRTFILLDSTDGLSPRDKAMLARRLLVVRAELLKGPAPREKAALARELLAVRKQLGGAAQATADQDLAYLSEVAAGKHDSTDLKALLSSIGAAIRKADADGRLAGDLEKAANDAITRWAELDATANG